MRIIKRAVHFDYHTMPGIYNINEQFDAAPFAQTLADAHVDYINFFALCNLGFCYYPTKVGIPYPGIKGDMLGDILNECHKRGIGVTAYINIGLMHELMRKHPEWCRVDKGGQIILGDRTANFFRTLCYNSPQYHEFLLAIIKEICAYDIDGLFCDCMQYFPCHCNACTEDMIKEGIPLDDEDQATEFSKRVMYRVSQEIKDIVGPDRYLYLNGMPYYDYRNLQTHVEIECLPSGGWGYDFFWPHVSYARNIQKTVLYMTGRFQASWGDFGGYKGKISIENDLYDGLCNNVLPSVGDHMHPAYGVVGDIYKDVGEIYSRISKYEKYTLGARYFSDIGVITDSAGYLGADYTGLARMLAELKFSFDIVHKDMDISRFALVILPDHMTVDEELGKKLRSFVDNGGRILSSGFSGLRSDASASGKFEFALPEYAIDINGKDESNVSYFNFTNLPEGSADMPWAMYAQAILMTARNKADERARYVKAYFSRHWDGLHGYFYCPPEKETGNTAAAVCGHVAHICFPVFEAYNQCAMREHKLLVKQIIDELLPKPLLRCCHAIPSTSRVTLTGTNDYKLLHVKTTYPEPRGKFDIVEEHGVLMAGSNVSIRGEYKSAALLPDETPVKSEIKDGYTVVTLPEIKGYDMFVLR
ncbi:hypothetical protein AGMMS49992_19960 [Clostridia bacterium]|nr:hypothetical protein AGMMS49992_19960 [Clostridia bacterium]